MLAIGTKMPAWVDTAYKEYANRLGRDCKLTLQEIASPRRSNAENRQTVRKKEGEALMAALPNNAYPIALDEQGSLLSTRGFANKLQQLDENAQSIALFIGGADGLSDDVLTLCCEKWSLSKLTFPHAMVRVIVAEQIYRSVSLLKNHPYHRE